MSEWFERSTYAEYRHFERGGTTREKSHGDVQNSSVAESLQ
jgi:hypothetical protein